MKTAQKYGQMQKILEEEDMGREMSPETKRMREEITTFKEFGAIGTHEDVANKYGVGKGTAYAYMRKLQEEAKGGKKVDGRFAKLEATYKRITEVDEGEVLPREGTEQALETSKADEGGNVRGGGNCVAVEGQNHKCSQGGFGNFRDDKYSECMEGCDLREGCRESTIENESNGIWKCFGKFDLSLYSCFNNQCGKNDKCAHIARCLEKNNEETDVKLNDSEPCESLLCQSCEEGKCVGENVNESNDVEYHCFGKYWDKSFACRMNICKRKEACRAVINNPIEEAKDDLEGLAEPEPVWTPEQKGEFASKMFSLPKSMGECRAAPTMDEIIEKKCIIIEEGLSILQGMYIKKAKDDFAGRVRKMMEAL